jgi:hypothetical protein
LEVNTVQSFIWSYYTIKSRAFDISVTEDVVMGLVPLVDLANHDINVLNTNELILTKPDNVVSYLVRSPADVGSDVELLQQYNMYAEHAKYLYYYGFLHDDLAFTTGDYITLSAAAAGGAGGAPTQAIVLADGKVPGRFLSAVHGGGGGDRAAALTRLEHALAAEIAQLPTTLEADQAALVVHDSMGGGFDGVNGVALLLRVRFKRVLVATMAWVRVEMGRSEGGVAGAAPTQCQGFQTATNMAEEEKKRSRENSVLYQNAPPTHKHAASASSTAPVDTAQHQAIAPPQSK